jgi:hypothetical protein
MQILSELWIFPMDAHVKKKCSRKNRKKWQKMKPC